MPNPNSLPTSVSDLITDERLQQIDIPYSVADFKNGFSVPLSKSSPGAHGYWETQYIETDGSVYPADLSKHDQTKSTQLVVGGSFAVIVTLLADYKEDGNFWDVIVGCKIAKIYAQDDAAHAAALEVARQLQY